MESCFTCDSPKRGVVNCIAELQEFKDRNAYSTLGQLTSDRMPVSSFQNEGTCFCPFPTADLSVDSSLMFPGCERHPPISHTSCCAELCVFSSFRILPHKSVCLTFSLWEQLFSAFPPFRPLVSGNGY